MKNLMCTICLVLALLVSGCATAMNGRYQTVKVTSDPPGVRVSVNEQHTTTPGELVLLRNVEVDLLAQLDGYHSEWQRLEPQLNNWIFGNAFIMTPGIITAAWDYATGAGFELKPDRIHFELVPEGLPVLHTCVKKKGG